MLKQNNIYIIQIILNRSRKNYNYNRYVKLQCVQVSLLINAKKQVFKTSVPNYKSKHSANRNDHILYNRTHCKLKPITQCNTQQVGPCALLL